MLIQSFSVFGFLGKKDVHITFKDLLELENGEKKQLKILVGENGIGKTQLLNMFYCALNQDIFKLAEYNFDSLEIKFKNNQSLNITKAPIQEIIDNIYIKHIAPVIFQLVFLANNQTLD